MSDINIIAPIINLDDPSLYINREISQLEFQRRVLEEAQDKSNPLLERVKFLAIVGSNLDEFFMVRVAGLKKQVDAGVINWLPDGMTPAEQLAAIRKYAQQLMNEVNECWQDEISPALNQAGIHVLDYKQLADRQQASIKKYFDEVIFPILTPLALDPGHPFPHISNLSLNLAVLVRDPQGQDHFARIKVPDTISRLVPIKRSSGSVKKDGTVPYDHYFVWLEQVIAANLDLLFPGMTVVESHPFRVIRDADMDIQEWEAADLLETMENTVRQRRFGSVVSVAINPIMPSQIRNILTENLGLERNDIYPIDGPLGTSALMGLYNIDRHELKEISFKPALPEPIRSDDNDIFAAIRHGNILLHHPYDSFVPVVNFLKQAARDPDVMAIKQTLYRVGKNSPVVDALLEAVQNGKQVAVLVELKARFDEESNISWAKMLEAEGVHVVYGLIGLKTHCKVALVIRKEEEGIRRYIHLATGNYNAITAQLYEDIGMFTCDEDIGADATDLFNYLTGYSAKNNYRKLLVAPINLRSHLESLIHREIEHQKKGDPSHLIFKINHLVDPAMIKLLYQASQSGVKIDLLVRGACCLRSDIKDISDKIRVTSIVGRFLEHSRIYYFMNGGKEEIYLGSADLMPRNLDRRVEVLFPIQDEAMIHRIRDDILSVYMKDNIKNRTMSTSGKYERTKPADKETPFNSQAWFIKQRESS